MVFEQKCSFYSNVRKANCVEMTLEEFVARIKNGSWKAPVEMYQRLMAEGEKSKAKELKNKLPGLVVAGYCEGSHAMKNLRSWSGDTMLDMDLTLGRAAEFLEMLKPVPWIKAGWRSVSYDGLKVVVRIEAEDPEEYAVAYAVVAWHIERIIEFGCDMCCKNPTRLCYASYDELAFYKDDAPVFPWRDFVEQNPDVANELLPPAMRRTPFAEAAEAAAQTAAEHTPAPGMLRALFNDFLARNPFVEGARNEFLLKLGRVARYKGLSESELQQLVALAVERLADAGCPPQDIGPKIKSGYRYVDLNSTPENQDLNPRFSRSKAQGPLCENFGPRGKEEKTENERLEEDKLKKAVPFFPKTVYDNLPDLIQRGLKAAHSNREKDRLLLGMLVNLSACMPGVWMSYSDEYCTPHFYALNLAGAGRGKGVVTLGAILPDAIQRYLDGKNRQAWTEYEKKDWRGSSKSETPYGRNGCQTST